VPVVLPLLALDVIVLVLWCIALALAIALIMDKLSSILAGVPWVGGKLSDAVKSMAKAISGAAGRLEGGIDHLVGAAWHQLARYIDKLWTEFVTHAHVIQQLAGMVGTLAHGVAGIRSLVHGATRALHVVLHRFVEIGRELHGIEHGLKRLERDLTKGIGHDLRIGLRDLRKEVRGIDHTVTTTIPQAIEGVGADVIALGHFIGVKAGTKYREWVQGIVLAGLAALGLQGLVSRCNPLKDNPNPCAWWNDLSALLGLATATLAALEFEALIKEMQAIEHDVTVAAKDVFGIG
jgi:hypothetical protein